MRLAKATEFFIQYFTIITKKYCKYIWIKKNKPREMYMIIDEQYLHSMCFILKHSTYLQFKILNDIVVVDYPDKAKRFEVIYNLTSTRYNYRLFLKCYTAHSIDSIQDIYKSAGWLERENWDLFGVYFRNNDDLRRILTDYGFEGHPMRKDFPLSGYIEVRYDDEKASIVYEPIEITQEYRFFNYVSPWESFL